MNIFDINPYIRLATYSVLYAPFFINNRIIFDYEIIYVEEGEGLITMNGNPHRYTQGDILVIPPGVEHRFDSVGNSVFSQPHIHFDMAYDVFSTKRIINFKNYPALSAEERLMISENIFNNAGGHIIINTKSKDRFLKSFFGIIELFSANRMKNELTMKSEMCSLLNIVLEAYPNTALASTNPPDMSMALIKNYLDANYTNSLSLDDICRSFHMNKYTLLRKFRTAYGQTVMKYVNDLKFRAAVDMLKMGTSVTDISDQLGFENIYTFSRFFKNSSGLSPSAFRNEKLYPNHQA